MAKKTTVEKSGKVGAKKSGATAKAGAASKKVAAQDAQRELLAKELRSMIPQLDAEGLAFLIEQGRVHLYNMQVDKLNSAAEAADAAARRTGSLKGASRAGGTAKGAGSDFIINGSESGSSYYLHFKNNEIMLSKDEMIHLVKIVNAKGTDLEIRERLFNWLDRERRDFFALVNIADKFDPRLKKLVAVVRGNFKIREKG